MKKKDLFEICSGVVFCFLISSFTALFIKVIFWKC